MLHKHVNDEPRTAGRALIVMPALADCPTVCLTVTHLHRPGGKYTLFLSRVECIDLGTRQRQEARRTHGVSRTCP